MEGGAACLEGGEGGFFKREMGDFFGGGGFFGGRAACFERGEGGFFKREGGTSLEAGGLLWGGLLV